MVYTYILYGVCDMCTDWATGARTASKKAEMETYRQTGFPYWVLEAALQLKIFSSKKGDSGATTLVYNNFIHVDGPGEL